LAIERNVKTPIIIEEYLEINEWIIDESILSQGSDAVLSAYLKQPSDFRYPQKSPINPITPEFQERLYKKLHETATPELARALFLEQYSPYEDIDISAEIYPAHGFLGFDGGIHACSHFVISGRMKKRIGDKEYVLHGTRKQIEDKSTGGLFFDGDINNLKPEMIVTEKPKIKFELARNIPQETRKSLGRELLNSHLNPYFHGGIGEGPYEMTKDGWLPADSINTIGCQYKDEYVGDILKGMAIIEKHGLSIQPTESGIYILEPAH
jgi:hypothetical protein